MKAAPRFAWYLGAILFMASLCPGLLYAQGDVMLEDKGVMDILDDIQNDAVTTWWHKDWKYRRKINIEDPRLLTLEDQAILLADPDVLLLYNTRECAPGGADFRIIDAAGKPLPAGITHFGRDDGSSQIWCLAPGRPNLRSLQLFLYYGNPNAKPQGSTFPEAGGQEGDPQFVQAGAEEIREGGGAAPLAKGAFFKDIALAEAEKFTAEKEERLETETVQLEASGEGLLVWKRDAARDQPATVWSSVQLPAAGAWKAHVRYRSTTGRARNRPFTLLIGGKEYECGQVAAENAPAYGWSTHEMQLPAGEVKIGLRLADRAAPDVVLFSRDSRYVPDYRDINGPVWMRAQATGQELAPFYVDLFGMWLTWNQNGVQGNTSAYLLKDRLIFPKKTQAKTDNGGLLLFNEIPPYVKEMVKKPEHLLQAGEWTPWGRALPRGQRTWWTEIRFVAGGKKPGPNPVNLKVQYQFATRPDISRIFREGQEETEHKNDLTIHMHATLDLESVREDTYTWQDWARRRLAMVKGLGLEPEAQPRKIVVHTGVSAQSKIEADNSLQILKMVGFNNVLLNGLYGSRQGDVLARNGIPGTWNYFRSPYKALERYLWREVKGEFIETVMGTREPRLEPLPAPAAGLTADAAVDQLLGKAIDADKGADITKFKASEPWMWENWKFNDLDDEIGPAVSSHEINKHPLLHGQFIEFLQKNGRQPADFGVKTWAELKALDYTEALSAKEQRTEQIKKDVEAAEARLDDIMTGEGGGLDDGPAATLEDPIKKIDEEKKAAEELKEKERRGLVEQEQAPLLEKRLYTWTQRYRSYFTSMYYRHHTQTVARYGPPGIKSSPNLQASPIQAGNMWDGALNVWDLGRLNAFSALQVEDWHHSPVNVRFGMNMMSAAARKNGQPLSLLTVGGHPGQRIITSLMEGTRYYNSFWYGPLFAGGPPWAEDPAVHKDWNKVLRQVTRAEDDILAAKGRPREAAVLVANSSEINSRHFESSYDNERMAVYGALWDAQIPTDLVAEEEIWEDNALARYKVLYVCDPHVDARAATKIKEWVRAGGTLWADYDALARDEYDQPVKTFDEVLGLKARPDLVPYKTRPWNGKLPDGLTIKVQGTNGVAAQEITGVLYSPMEQTARSRPELAVGEGKVIATFEDGKPAALHHTFGKGQVWFFAFPAALTYSGQWEPHGYNFARVAREGTANPQRGTLITAAARAAQAATQLKVDQHMLFTDVHDGPAQSLVYLVNMGPEMKARPLEVKLPRQPKSASLASGGKVEFTYADGIAKLPITLPVNGYDIVVFKY